MPATFRVHEVVRVAGRGTVVVGDVMSGEARGGAWIVPLTGHAMRVDVVEATTGPAFPAGSVGLVLRDAPDQARIAEQLPTGSTVVLAEPLGIPVSAASGIACHRGLRRYWFPLTTGLGIGVTAASDDEAGMLAAEVQLRTAPTAMLLAPIVDVDVRTLDPGHVQPNVGPVVVRGVWFPRENL